MEFKSLTNIETSFRQIRLFALVFICLCALVTGFAVWNSYSFAEKQRQKIYVLDNGKSLMLALSQDMAQNRPVEAKSHVRRFHELFFTLSPDKGAIESNIKRSLFLADKTAFNYYKDLAEKGYYNRVISGNVTQTVEIDSVKCDFDQYPYKVNTYARQLIVRESSLTVRSLVTSCRLLNATRSDNNPHGFIIEAFTITENKGSFMELRGTTILAVRHKGHVALIGDGQVTMGQSIVMKHTAKKVRRMYKDQIVAGFAGATADAFTLFERFDAHLEQTGGNLIRAAVELAKDWRSDKFLRKLEAMLLVADRDHTLVLTGTGDVIEPDDGIASIGSGGPYALSAARALVRHSDLGAEDIALESMKIASELCVFTNGHYTLEVL